MNLFDDYYVELLKNELLVAQGCTEPLAVAYLGSVARHVLGTDPEEVFLECSNNIIKNVRCVSIPNAVDMQGIMACCMLGIYGGDHTQGYGSIKNITDEAKQRTKDAIDNQIIKVKNLVSEYKLHMKLKIMNGNNYAYVEIAGSHLNIIKVIRNDNVLYEKEYIEKEVIYNKDALKFSNIFEFVNRFDISLLRDMMENQIECNMDIAKAGIDNNYGVGIGNILLEKENNVYDMIKAYTSAASEARMCGCVKPVVINSGSGNQGISTSVPVIVYAHFYKINRDTLISALVLANLLTIKQKYKIGPLSAFCGVVSSCCSASAAITYLAGGTSDQIKQAMKNHLAIVPGIICDGAKASCAAKIAICLESAILSHKLAINDTGYLSGIGIIKDTIDETIDVVSSIGHDGMRETDEEIMKNLL